MNPVNKESATNDEERGVLQIIRDIKNGALDPRSLLVDDRRACVMHLGLEGLSAPEIAQVLRVSDRTVARDRKAIQEGSAIEHDPALAGRVAGRLVQEADAAVARLRRIARDKDTPPAVKVDGERSAFEVLDKTVARLQSLGFLPQATQHVQADLTHSVGDLSNLAALRDEVERLEKIECDQIKVITPSATPVAATTPTTDPKGENA